MERKLLSCSDASVEILQTNEDIVYEILKFLPLRSRKQARLVCTLWNRVCTQNRFSKSEVFSIPPDNMAQSVIQVLKKCRKEIYNLRLKFMYVRDSWNVFWQNYGWHIVSLEIDQCDLSFNVWLNIIKHCVNLTELKVFFLNAHTRDPFSPRVVDYFIHEEVRWLKLETLHFLNAEHLLSELYVPNISQLFPNVQNLYLQIQSLDHAPLNFFDLLDSLVAEFRRIKILEVVFAKIDLLNSFWEMAGLFEAINDNSLVWRGINAATMRLEVVGLGRLNSYLKSFPKFWTKLDVCRLNSLPADLPACRQLLLNSAILQQLDLTFSLPVLASDFGQIFKTLVELNLETLRLTIEEGGVAFSDGFYQETETWLRDTGLGSNHTVIHLHMMWKFSLNPGEKRLDTLFSEYFQNVRHVLLFGADVQLIFRNYKNRLKSLDTLPVRYPRVDAESCALHEIEDLEFLAIIPLKMFDLFSVCKFSNLKYLVWNDSNCGHDRVQELARLFKVYVVDRGWVNVVANKNTLFYKLEENIDLNISVIRFAIILGCVWKNSPNLEGIALQACRPVDEEGIVTFFKICQKFSRIRYVAMKHSNMEEDLDFDEFYLKRELVNCFNRRTHFSTACVFIQGCEFHFYFNAVDKKFEFSLNNPHYRLWYLRHLRNLKSAMRDNWLDQLKTNSDG